MMKKKLANLKKKRKTLKKGQANFSKNAKF